MLNQHRLCRSLLNSVAYFLFTFEIVKFIQWLWEEHLVQTSTSLLDQLRHNKKRMLFFSTQNQELFCWTPRSCFTMSCFPPTVSSQETVGWECFMRPLLSCIFCFDIWIVCNRKHIHHSVLYPSGFPFFFTTNYLWKLQLNVLKMGFWFT